MNTQATARQFVRFVRELPAVWRYAPAAAVIAGWLWLWFRL